MGLDYYGILGVTKNAKRSEIQDAYRKLSIRCHPEQESNRNVNVMTEFTLIAEAYDVLGQSLYRCVYDQFGEEGLKRGIYGPDQTNFEPYTYHGNPFVTFRQFFGCENPHGNFLKAWLTSDSPKTFQYRSRHAEKPKPVRIDLELTLKELYFSCRKKMKIYRRVFTDEKRTQLSVKEKLLTIPIAKSLAAGTEIVFKEEGDQGVAVVAGDVIFVTKDAVHDRFRRNQNDDLILRQRVSLQEALLGTMVRVQTLDDRILRIAITDIIQ